MTTETGTERTERSEIDMRWGMVMYGRPVRLADDGGISLHPTKVFYRVDRGLEDIAASLCDDGVWDEEMQEGGDSLMDLTGETWTVIEKMFKEWAARAPQRREIIRAGWAAEEAARKAGTAA